MSQAKAWELLARRLEAFRPQAFAVPEQDEASEEAMDGPDTGLSGLRKLLLAPGMKANLSRQTAPQGVESAAPAEGLAVQQMPPRSYTPLPRGTAGKDMSAASPREAQAARNPPFESEEKEHAWEDTDNARRDRRDPVDPVQILPSWRGQYKKKKK